METLVSGLREDLCREFVGDESWKKHAIQWCAPADIAEQATGRQIVWLYRMPWATDGCNASDMHSGLARWLKENRAALNLRRQLGGNLLLVNADRVSPLDLRARLAGSEPGGHPATTASIGSAIPHNDALARLFDYAAPEYWEVFEALEATSWLPSGEPIFRGTAGLDQEQLFSLLEALAEPPRLNAEIARLRKSVDDDAHINRKLQQSQQELKQEGELLLLQLHQVQEELEQYYLKNIELDKKNGEFGKKAAELDKVIARDRKALADAQGSNKALQVQLRQMQDELKRQLALNTPPAPIVQSAQPMPNPLSRLLPGTARKVLGQSRRKRAQQIQLAAIRGSEWFDRQWYLDSYPDIRAGHTDPVEHYLTTGWRENRNPSAGFDTAYYLRANPDIAQSGLNPLWHFIEFGRKEGRQPRKS